MTEDTAVETNIFQESYKTTREMYDVILNLQQSLHCSNNSAVADVSRSLGKLHQKIEQLDLEVDKYIHQTAVSLSAQQRAFLIEKKQLQKEILKLQKSLISQANNIKSILLNEISSLKTGRTALKGYGKSSKNPGRVINKSL